MRIVIDALGIEKHGGGRTAILNTLKALPQVAPEAQFIVYLSRFEPDLADLPHLQQRIIRTSNRFLSRLSLMWVLPYITRREHVDLVHFTKNLAVGFIACPQIITVFDLSALRHPEIQNKIDDLYWRWIEPISLKHANKIIAIAADVAHDIVEYYGISQQRVQVIRLAPDDRFRSPVKLTDIERVRETYQLPGEYVFFLGILARKKNLKTLIQSMEILRQRGNNYHLVIAGRRYLQSDASDELGLIETLGLGNNVLYIGTVADEDLPPLYAAASAYILPSLHEGFGIPCWEAMAVGVPVIASKRGALPEVVGDAGILIDDPLDAKAWADAIQQVTQNKTLRETLIMRGHCQVADRTWQTVASETFEVYKAVCGTRQ
jgi:glycosyltransferase involved in cell wall biosynthesis